MKEYGMIFKVIDSVDNEFTSYIARRNQQDRARHRRPKVAKPRYDYYPVRIAENGL